MALFINLTIYARLPKSLFVDRIAEYHWPASFFFLVFRVYRERQFFVKPDINPFEVELEHVAGRGQIVRTCNILHILCVLPEFIDLKRAFFQGLLALFLFIVAVKRHNIVIFSQLVIGFSSLFVFLLALSSFRLEFVGGPVSSENLFIKQKLAL